VGLEAATLTEEEEEEELVVVTSEELACRDWKGAWEGEEGGGRGRANVCHCQKGRDRTHLFPGPGPERVLRRRE